MATGVWGSAIINALSFTSSQYLFSLLNHKDYQKAQINDLFQELEQLRQEQKVAKVPTLSDYYKPSDEMKHYQNVASGIIGLASGATATGLVKASVMNHALKVPE